MKPALAIRLFRQERRVLTWPLWLVVAAAFFSEVAELAQLHTNNAEFLTVAEVAQRWQLNPETVRRMIRDGCIPSVLAGRHHIRPNDRAMLTKVEA
jgi:excisionase family DNA binding protein